MIQPTTVLALLISGSLFGGNAAAAVTAFDIFETAFYQQVDANTPTSAYSYTLAARAFFDSPMTDINFTVVGGATTDSVTGATGSSVEISHNYATLTDIENAYPPGTSYAYTLTSPDLSPNPWLGSLTLPASTFYAQNVPHFLNYAATQAIDPNAPFALQWDPFIVDQQTPVPDIFLVIRDSSQNILLNQFIADETATAFEIDASTLQPSQTYVATLYFSSRDPNAGIGDGGLSGLASYDRATSLSITTVPLPGAWILFGSALGIFGYSRRCV